MNEAILDLLVQRWLQMVNPPGLPWDRLAGGVRGTEYLQALLTATSKIWDVVGALDIEERYRTLRASQARGALSDLSAALSNSGAAAADAADKGVSELTLGDAITMSKDALKDSIATMAAYATNGAQLHFDGVVFEGIMAGEFTDEEVMAHADQVTRIAHSFTELLDSGALHEIRRQDSEAVSGLGLAPLAIPVWMLVVAGVFLILGLGYLFWSTHRASVLQDKVVGWCDQLIATDPKNAGACIDAMQNMSNDSLANLFGPIQNVVKWAGVALVVYVGIIAMPGLIRGLGEVFRQRRAA